MTLGKREKYFVSVSALAIVVFFLLQFLIFPFFESKNRIQRGVLSKKKGLKEIAMFSTEYQAYKKSSRGVAQSLARRKKGFTLFSFLDRAAGEAEVKTHMKYMKPSVSTGSGPYKESLVEMKLEGITLRQLVGYLYRIESPENVVSVKRISIRENKGDSGYLDAVLQVLTYR